MTELTISWLIHEVLCDADQWETTYSSVNMTREKEAPPAMIGWGSTYNLCLTAKSPWQTDQTISFSSYNVV